MDRLRPIQRHHILLAFFVLASMALFALIDFAQAAKDHAVDTPMAACISCHPRTEPTHWRQKPGEMRADLPLDRRGRMLCITCHDCVAGKCKLRSDDRRLCQVCHDCTQGMSCLIGTAHLGDSPDITHLSTGACMTCHEGGRAPRLCMLGNRTTAAHMDVKEEDGRIVIVEGKVTCVSCHNPYSAAQYSKLAKSRKGKMLCTTCHQTVEGFDHSRYDAVKECVACHPRTLPTHTRQRPLKMEEDLPLDKFGRMKCTTCHDCVRDTCNVRGKRGQICRACHDCTSGMSCYIGTPHIGDETHFGKEGVSACLGCHDGVVGQEQCEYGQWIIERGGKASCVSCHSIYATADRKITRRPPDGTYCPRFLREYDARACARCHTGRGHR